MTDRVAALLRSPLGWLVAGVVLLGAVGYVAHDMVGNINDPDRPSTTDRVGFADYRDTVPTPLSDLWVDHENPYDVDAYLGRHPGQQEFSPYSPGWLVLWAPLTPLPYETGEAVYFVLLVLQGLVLMWLVLRAFRLPATGPIVLLATAALVLTQPGRDVLYYGQGAYLISIGVVLAITEREARPTLAVLGVSLALLKPQTGVPLLVVLGLGLGAWRVAVKGTLVAAVLAVPAVIAASIASGGIGGFVRAVADDISYGSRVYSGRYADTITYRIDAASAIERIGNFAVSSAMQLAIGVALLGLTVVVVRRAAATEPTPSRAELVAVIGMLVAVVHFRADGALAVFALVGLGAHCWRAAPRQRAWWFVAVVLAVPFAHIYRVDVLIGSLGIPTARRLAIDPAAYTLAFLIGAMLLVRTHTGTSTGTHHRAVVPATPTGPP